MEYKGSSVLYRIDLNAIALYKSYPLGETLVPSHACILKDELYISTFQGLLAITLTDDFSQANMDSNQFYEGSHPANIICLEKKGTVAVQLVDKRTS